MLHGNRRKVTVGLVAVSLSILSTSAGAQQVRIATWNVSNYAGGRAADIQNAVYGSFEGRSMSPDVILGQEFRSSAAVGEFVNALNSATGSPGDWVAKFGTLNATNDSVFFYRSSKVTTFGDPLRIATGSTSDTNQPRDTYRLDVGLVGDPDASRRLALYNVHMKSGGSGEDVQRRQIEAQRIRENANSLGSNYEFILGGDFNMQSSSQQPYQTLTGSATDNRGRFFDPINTPGSWDNNDAYRFVHTQDPSGQGGMDSRYDFLLGGASLFDGVGLDYVGDRSKPYSTTTWNDPNHSYRVWGNDGTSFNSTLRTTGNSMVGASIAQSLINVATPSGGHLPVFMDVRVQAVPEPGTLAAVGVGLVALARRRRKRS